jgi:hypothetical protein
MDSSKIWICLPMEVFANEQLKNKFLFMELFAKKQFKKKS